jgi:hypothetical protein
VAPKWKQALERMKHNIEFARDYLIGFGYDAVSHIFRNQDGTIDAEVRIRSIPRGKKIREALLDMEAALPVTMGVWISSGIRYRYKPRDVTEDKRVYDPSADRVIRGLQQAGTYPRKDTPSKRAMLFVTARGIEEKLREKDRGKQRRKPEQIWVRLHWNVKDKKPKRGYGREWE